MSGKKNIREFVPQLSVFEESVSHPMLLSEIKLTFYINTGRLVEIVMLIGEKKLRGSQHLLLNYTSHVQNATHDCLPTPDHVLGCMSKL